MNAKIHNCFGTYFSIWKTFFFPVRLFLLLFIFDTLIRKTLNNNSTTITTQQ
ncbi:unnamed protein product [Acanthoscelides obtectus]|uniref:Uncharacterized protein n=1 Tax=Acanthoscelides obtectus TaxID=200917 RepID=A0A9P0JZ27_ACAOB|nr:unnamed protein product [Acanthoscelides obtectus]CAK1633852.1 hypothetical protein AOBTE_LOCUS8435 [Acanthoscelides obtectus]